MGNLVTGFKNLVDDIAAYSKNCMAIDLHEQGKWHKAEEIHREVLEARRRVLGEEHPDTLDSRNNLANILADQGRWQEAEEMHREVLEVRRRVLGQEHLDTLDSRNNLAYILHEQGKWQEAEEMHREVLEIMSRVLGEDHPRTLMSMRNLAHVLAERDEEDRQCRYSLNNDAHFGRLGDAINKLRTSIAAQTLRVDDEHPDLLRCRVDLAVLLIQMNEERGLKEAEDLLRQSVSALRERYGPMKSLTLRATRHLVFLLEERGKDAEEWRQHLPDMEGADTAISFRERDLQESLEDCEHPEVAELVRDFLAKQRLQQILVVDPSSASSSTPAAQGAASAAPTSSIAPSQRP